MVARSLQIACRSRVCQEGAPIVSFKLVEGGKFNEAGITEVLEAPGKIKPRANEPPSSGTRNLRDNLSDLKAQVAANHKGIVLVGELIKQYSLRVVQAYMHHIQVRMHSRCIRAELC